MAAFDTATALSAWAAIIVSVLTTRQSLRLASKLAADASQHDLKLAQTEAVLDLTSQYRDLLQEGEQFEDEDWAFRYWGLVATEFYFFDHGWLPSSIYELWIIELVTRGYDLHPTAWTSHQRHMKQLYAVNYTRMYKFFVDVHQIASSGLASGEERNRAIARFVQSQHGVGRQERLRTLS